MNLRTISFCLSQSFLVFECCGWTHKKRIARCIVFQEHFPQIYVECNDTYRHVLCVSSVPRCVSPQRDWL
jgi:hypothetical protein